MLDKPKMNPRILFGALLVSSLVLSFLVYGQLKGDAGESLLWAPKWIGIDAGALAELPPAGSQGQLREALAWDFGFIALYVFNLWMGLRFLALFAERWSVQVPAWAYWLPPAAGLMDMIENRRLIAVLDGAVDNLVPFTVSLAATVNALLVILVFLVALWTILRVLRWPAWLVVPAKADAGADPPADFDSVLRAEAKAIGETSSRRTVGLAFSGGGIRSATFNLGILQALAEVKLLDRIHYLSTVSGGSYIGAWLTQWMRRGDDATKPGVRLRRVQKQMRQQPTQEHPEPDPIQHLRSYSNYLTPRLGLLSADTWATIATYLRNLLLNLVIIVSLVSVALLLPRAVVDWLEFFKNRVYAGTALEAVPISLKTIDFAVRHSWSVAAAAALAFTSIISMGINLAGVLTRRSQRGDKLTSQAVVQAAVVLPLVAAAVFASYWLANIGLGERFWLWVAASSVMYASSWFLSMLVALPTVLRDDREFLALTKKFSGWIGAALVAGAGSGAALGALTHFFELWSVWELVTLGPPCVLMLFATTAVLHVGLMGRGFDDHLREWLARAGAWLMIYSLAWLFLTGAAFYGSVVVAHLGTWARTAIASGWLATSIAGVLAGKAQQQGKARSWQRPLVLVAPWIFIAGLVCLLSSGLDQMLSAGSAEWAAFTAGEPGSLSALLGQHDQVLTRQIEDGKFWAWLFAFVALTALFSWRVAINEFSMHHYYRNRLVRAYLGASNPGREENPFTGFDPADDSCLGTQDENSKERASGGAMTLPFQLIGTALNIVHGERLGWQERKAASFFFSPLYSGFGLPSSTDSDEPSDAFRSSISVKDLTLGTAMAISGAAASPNMGFRSTPALTLLLAVFNVRLGWWLGNPRYPDAWKRGGPGIALRPLISELFGLTSDTSEHVYLSDGGHFENLGLYELVRRRCRFIVVCDAAADPDLEFTDLGNAIRKCRTDFGAEIDLNTRMLEREEGRLSRRHCSVGRIRYAADSPGGRPQTGLILYIKASLTGDEPEDVAQYAKRHPDFPHQSTADQFFDESQFESYRALGRHIGNRVFRSASDHLEDNFHGWEILFRELHERWFAPSAAVETSFTRHGQSLERIFERMGGNEDFGFLDRQVYPEWDTLARQALGTANLPNTEKELRSGFYLCSSLIQLMEGVYLDLRMDDEHTHPDNRGWMNLFKQWVQSPMMQATWALSAGTYGSRFQTFCKRWLKLHHGWVELGRPFTDPLPLLEGIERALPPAGKKLKHLIDTAAAEQREYSWIPLRLTALGGSLDLEVGYCVVEQSLTRDLPRLVYFEVERHLRNTGLARRGIYALKKQFPKVQLIPDSRRLPFEDRKWHRFRNLFESALDAGKR